PTLFAAVVFGPLAAMVVAAASMLGAFGSPYLKWATYTSARSLTGAATGLAASWVSGLPTTHVASLAMATTAGALVSQTADASFATALVTTLDARDRYTAGHSAAVAIYARDIASRLGLSEDQPQLAHLCGLVHDIGKIGLAPGLLEKPGALTLEERRQMQEHSAIGERILAKVEDYAEIAKIVRHHHERIDGMGYPDGIAGQETPLI